MKIIVIADVESKSLWDYFHPKKLEGIELIISCGDLNPKYLSFLATFFHGDVLYVHGNHDEIYESDPPLGCVCVEDRIVVYKGIRIMGLGGSIDYNGGKFQYTQKEMNRRCRKLWFALKKHSGIDILVTHAPAFKMNDGIDYPHQGFQAFQKIIDYWHPRFFVHGHIHLNYGHNMNRVSQYKSTVIVNAYDHYVIEW